MGLHINAPATRKRPGAGHQEIALMPASAYKRCTRCEVTKPASDFARRNSAPDGLEYRCRPCIKEQRREKAGPCEMCGGPKSSYERKICAQCIPASQAGEQNSNWKGDAVSRAIGHDRARRMFTLPDQCEGEGCEAPPYDRHHIDGDTLNNTPENIAFLCRSCHMQADGRLRVLQEAKRESISRS